MWIAQEINVIVMRSSSLCFVKAIDVNKEEPFGLIASLWVTFNTHLQKQLYRGKASAS